MKNGDLKIVRVYTQDGKQVAFDVQNAAGTQRVDKATVVGAIKNGHSYVNATVTSSGVVRVDANVPRLPMQRNKLKVQAILYSPAIVREGALGALVKCDDVVKACTYDEFCSTVNNYECDLDDREAVVCFNPKKPFKNGYKYIDISKKDFLKSKVYKMSTPALKELVRSLSGNKTNTTKTNTTKTKTNTTKTNIDTSLAPYDFKSDNMGFTGIIFSSNLDDIKDETDRYICNNPAEAKPIFYKTFELTEPYDKYFNEDLCADKTKYIKRIEDYLNEHYPKERGYAVLWDSNFTSIPELIFTTNEDGELVYDFDGLIHTKFYIFDVSSCVNPKEDAFNFLSSVYFTIEHLKTLIEWTSKDINSATLSEYGYSRFLRDEEYGNYIDINTTYNCLCLNSPTGSNTGFRGCGMQITPDGNCAYLIFYDKNVYKKLLPLYKKLDEVLYKKQHK